MRILQRNRPPPVLHLLAVSALLLVCKAAYPLDFSAGAFVAPHYFSANNELGRAESDPTPYGQTLGLGGRAALWLSDAFAVEGEAAILPARRNFNHFLISTGRVHALLRMKFDSLSLLALVGGGLMHSSPFDDLKNSVDTDPYSYAGVGAQWQLSPRVALRADARVHFTGSTVIGSSISTEGELTG